MISGGGGKIGKNELFFPSWPCRTRQTCPANFGNAWRRAVAKFNKMSCEKLEMSGESQNNFAYSEGDANLFS